MHEIILICTLHEDSGKCNSIELYDIIKNFEPQVIFEELSHSNFIDSYQEDKLITLETNAIKYYLKTNKVKHIPVDTYPLPKNYHYDLYLMYDRILNSNTIKESRELQNIIYNFTSMKNERGFELLNSEENDKHFEKFDSHKKKILKVINNENLLRIQKLEKEIIEKREYEIIKNIYKFSSENAYKNALMFIGSAHRKSVLELIKRFELEETIKLKWKIFNNLPST